MEIKSINLTIMIKAINKNLMLHSYQIRFMIKDKKYTYTACITRLF